MGTIGKPASHKHIHTTPAEAALAAYTYAKESKSPTAVITTKTRDIAEMIPAIIDAFRESLPIIFIAADEQKDITNGIDNTKRNNFGIDIVGMLRQITKAAVLVERPELLKYELRELSTVAVNGRPGPVLVELSWQLQQEMFPSENCKSVDFRKKEK